MTFLANLGATFLFIVVSFWSGTLGVLHISHNSVVVEAASSTIGAPRVSWNEGEVYTKDSLHVYYGDMVVKGADPATFELLLDSQGNKTDYAKDKNHVYDSYLGSIVEGADPATFSALNFLYGKDAFFVYSMNPQVVVDDSGRFPIPGADVATFVVLVDPIECSQDKSCAFDSQDKNHKYKWGQIVQEI